MSLVLPEPATLQEEVHVPAPRERTLVVAPRENRPRKRRVRTLFLSDVHLGCRYARTEALVRFIESVQPDRLYLVGDIFDGWKLRRRWYWNDDHGRFVRWVVDRARSGCPVYYTPGNHDDFLRGFLGDLRFAQIADEFVHHAADGRRYLVTHGDYFDGVENRAKWLSWLGDHGYEVLLAVNAVLNRAQRALGIQPRSLSRLVKRKVKEVVSFLSDFEGRLERHARERGCDGVICGHVHTPRLHEAEGFDYFNTGDWVESCTALVEELDGTFELIHVDAWSGSTRGVRTVRPSELATS